jgi:hypothetical protein
MAVTAALLLRAGAPDAPADLTELRALPHVDPGRFDAAHAELRERGHVAEDGTGLTATGVATRDQLVAARTDCLRGLIEDWEARRAPGARPAAAAAGGRVGRAAARRRVSYPRPGVTRRSSSSIR